MPLVGALLATLPGLGVGDQRDRPKLELVLVGGGELAGAVEVHRHAMHVEFDALEGVAQPAPDQVDGDMGNVDADPPPVEFFGGMDGGAAAAERVEHQVAGVGGGGNDALQQGDGFLGGVTEFLLGTNLLDIVPIVRDRAALGIFQIFFVLWDCARL